MTWKQAEGVPSAPSYLQRHWLQDLANTSPNDLRVARVDRGIKASNSYLAAGEEKIEEISLFSNGREYLFWRKFAKGLSKE